jgi:hypothetical protein
VTGWLSPQAVLYRCRRRHSEAGRKARELTHLDEPQAALDALYAAGWVWVSITHYRDGSLDRYEVYPERFDALTPEQAAAVEAMARGKWRAAKC